MKLKRSEEKKLLPRIELGKSNLILFFVGAAILVLGFLLMSIGPWDNPLSRSVAPIVLLIGYMVVFPVAIFFQRSSNGDSQKSKYPEKQQKTRSPKRDKYATQQSHRRYAPRTDADS